MDDLKYKLEEFSYKLPEELIAQHPLEERDACRLMLVNRQTGEIKHARFNELIDYLSPGDCLVMNDTKVFPARLRGKKDKSGAHIEVFLLRNLEGNTWEVLVKPARRVRIGNKILFEQKLSCDIIDNTVSGGRIVEFNSNSNFYELLEELGNTPLPPYIKREANQKDRDYYQTVYAEKTGAVAAPTAGMHFTRNLLRKIENKGINLLYITLHPGLGTFRPVQVDDISRHKMDGEYYEIEADVAHQINERKEEGNKIVAIGTTTVRALETVTDPRGFVRPSKGWTDKFIYPPYEFKAVDRLITNFHLPHSTLLMMVSAFSSLALMKKAYREAVNQKYRFFSYGDAMFIL